MLCVLCAACANCCFVYNVLTHALVLQWARVLVPIQLQFSALMSCGWLFLIMRVLCLVIIDLTLLMQLLLTLTVYIYIYIMC